MKKPQQTGIPLRRRDKQPDKRYKAQHMITAHGLCDQRGTRTLTAGVQKRAEVLFARTVPQLGSTPAQTPT